MLAKLVSTSALVAVGLTALTAAGAAPAQAGVSNTSLHRLPGNANCDQSNLRNRGQFVHTTDNLKSTDECPDGWGADTEILLQNGRYERCYNTGGNNTTLVCNLEFAEGLIGHILARSFDDGNFVESGEIVPIIT